MSNYYFITDFYYPGIPYRKFLEEAFKTHYPIDDKISNFMRDYKMLMQPDVMAYGAKEGSKEERKLYKNRNIIFQFWTKEYLDGLAVYLNKEHPREFILEVGAGMGELTQELKKRGVNIVATDDYSWKEGMKRPKWVEKINYKEAIKKYCPSVVICSWMMLYEDWTPAFRANYFVKEYILIGEVNAACATSETFVEYPGWKEREGFDFDRYNLCRTDFIDRSEVDPEFYKGYSMKSRHSYTTSYKRFKKVGLIENTAFKASRVASNAWENSWRTRLAISDLWGLKSRLRAFYIKNFSRDEKLKARLQKDSEQEKTWASLMKTGRELSKSYRGKEGIWLRLKKFLNQRVY